MQCIKKKGVSKKKILFTVKKTMNAMRRVYCNRFTHCKTLLMKKKLYIKDPNDLAIFLNN